MKNCPFLQKKQKKKTIHNHKFGFEKCKCIYLFMDIYASILKALEKKEKAC